MLRVALFLLGAGFALLTGSACEGSWDSGVEVLEQASLAVLLSESDGVPVHVLSNQRILAGRQHVLVSRRDPERRQQRRDKLIQLDLSPGPQRLELGGDDDDEPIVVAFESVSKDQIVGIELLQPNEEELSPGTWVEVDVVGVTADGTQVRSIHPRVGAGNDTYLGYFAYRFDPDAEPKMLNVDALDRQIQTKFRGAARAVMTFGLQHRPERKDKVKPASVLKR